MLRRLSPAPLLRSAVRWPSGATPSRSAPPTPPATPIRRPRPTCSRWSRPNRSPTEPEPEPEPEPPAACAKTKRGTAGPDRLNGTTAGDRLLGFGGNDRLRGLGGADCLLGARGNDTLIGGSGGDRLEGGRGRDRLLARDGTRDRIFCGVGRDVAVVDRKDVVRRCETVRRPPARRLTRF